MLLGKLVLLVNDPCIMLFKVSNMMLYDNLPFNAMLSVRYIILLLSVVDVMLFKGLLADAMHPYMRCL